jgi:hypothetical protein
MLEDIGIGKDDFGQDPKSTGNKTKNRQVVLYQTKKLHTVKEAIVKLETTYRMEKYLQTILLTND